MQLVNLESAEGEAIWDSLAEGMMLVDVAGTVKRINPAASRILGRTVEELTQATTDPWLHALRPDGTHFPPHEQPGIVAIRGGAAVRGVEMTVPRADNRWVWLVVNAHPIRGADGRTTGAVTTFTDITRSREMQEALREASRRQRAVLNNMAAPAWLKDARGRYEVVNTAWCELLGLAPDDAIGKTDAELWPPEIAQRFQAEDMRVLASGEKMFHEERIVDVGGVDRWYETTKAPILDDAGRGVGVVGLAHEITARKAALEAFHKAEARFRGYFHLPLVALCITSPDKGWVEVNDRLCDLLGYPRQELTRMSWAELTHPADLGKDLALFESVLAGEKDGYELEKRFIRKDGAVVHTQLAVQCARREDRTVDYFVASLLDISEPKRAEEALRLSETKFATAFANNPAAIALTRLKDGLFYDVNDTWVALTGYERSEAIGNSSRQMGLWPSTEAAERFVQALRTEGTIRGWEETFRKKSGEPFVAELSAQVLTMQEEQVILSTLVDVTRRKHLEEELRHSQKLEAVGQLAGGIAHDFNNILAGMLLQLGFLAKDAGLSASSLADVQELIELAKRGSALVRQLLLFSRRQAMQPILLELDSHLDGQLKLLRRLIGEHIQLSFERSESPSWIQADPGMIEQVVMNLCLNARDAIPREGQINLTTSVVEVGQSSIGKQPEVSAGRYVCLEIRDNGSGIDASALQHIFEPFFTTKDVGKGTGLGLATVYGIVKQHKGWIEVQSRVGVGTAFRIYLPAAEPRPSAASPVGDRQVSPGGGEPLLLVEDEAGLRKLMAVCLRRCGYEVYEAENGPDALRVWDQHAGSIEVLVSDMMMPGGMTGLELAGGLRSRNPSLGVVIVSGYGLDLAEPDAVGSGRISLLAKPFDPAALLKAVRQVLDGGASAS